MSARIIQKRFFQSTAFQVEYDGIKINKKDFNRQSESFVRYEEIPSGNFAVRIFDRRLIILSMIFGVLGAFGLLIEISSQPLRIGGLLGALAFIIIPILITWFARNEYIGLGRVGNGVVLQANKPSRQEVKSFVDALQNAKSAYLREIYLDKVPTATPQEELKLLLWLYEHGAINENELQIRRQRLQSPKPTGGFGFGI